MNKVKWTSDRESAWAYNGETTTGKIFRVNQVARWVTEVRGEDGSQFRRRVDAKRYVEREMAKPIAPRDRPF
jgi:hypothetical protein